MDSEEDCIKACEIAMKFYNKLDSATISQNERILLEDRSKVKNIMLKMLRKFHTDVLLTQESVKTLSDNEIKQIKQDTTLILSACKTIKDNKFCLDLFLRKILRENMPEASAQECPTPSQKRQEHPILNSAELEAQRAQNNADYIRNLEARMYATYYGNPEYWDKKLKRELELRGIIGVIEEEIIEFEKYVPSTAEILQNDAAAAVAQNTSSNEGRSTVEIQARRTINSMPDWMLDPKKGGPKKGGSKSLKKPRTKKTKKRPKKRKTNKKRR
jgi:hypothetical protein